MVRGGGALSLGSVKKRWNGERIRSAGKNMASRRSLLLACVVALADGLTLVPAVPVIGSAAIGLLTFANVRKARQQEKVDAFSPQRQNPTQLACSSHALTR